MFEHKTEKVVPRILFLRRLAQHFFLSFFLVLGALVIGILGYHGFAGLGWTDSLLNASMILGGMGPVDTLQSDEAKIFASLYALFSGLLFIGIMGILLSPVIHRVMHTLHAENR